jgi:hypothetical protein
MVFRYSQANEAKNIFSLGSVSFLCFLWGFSGVILWGQVLYFDVLELASLSNLSFNPNIKIQDLTPFLFAVN